MFVLNCHPFLFVTLNSFQCLDVELIVKSYCPLPNSGRAGVGSGQFFCHSGCIFSTTKNKSLAGYSPSQPSPIRGRSICRFPPLLGKEPSVTLNSIQSRIVGQIAKYCCSLSNSGRVRVGAVNSFVIPVVFSARQKVNPLRDTPHPNLPQSGEGVLVPSPTRGGLGWGAITTLSFRLYFQHDKK